MIVAGLEVVDIDERFTPLGLYMIVSVLDDDGDVTYVVRQANMDAMQRLGAVTTLQILERNAVLEAFTDDED